jgi:hypothetical protein
MLRRFANLSTARLNATRLQLLDIYRLDDGAKQKTTSQSKLPRRPVSFTGISEIGIA